MPSILLVPFTSAKSRLSSLSLRTEIGRVIKSVGVRRC